MKDTKYVTLHNVENCPLAPYCKDRGNDKICDIKMCHKGDNMNYFLAVSNLPKQNYDLFSLNFDNFANPNTLRFIEYLLSNINNFVESGFNAYFYGLPDVGKTTWAIAILIRYLQMESNYGKHRTPAVFVSVPDLLCDIKYYSGRVNTDLDDIITDIKSCPLVVWDDLVVTDLTTSETQFLYRLINYRLSRNLSNIYVNVTPPKILMIKNPNLYNKVCEHSSCIEIKLLESYEIPKFEELIVEIENNSEDN